MKNRITRLVTIGLTLSFICMLSLTGCSVETTAEEIITDEIAKTDESDESDEKKSPSEEDIPHSPLIQAQNLEKLCKVWGYVKYTHPIFLTGEKDWDEELLVLIPIVAQANEKDVNEILYEWFVSLGEIDRSTVVFPQLWLSAKEEDKHFLADTSWICQSFLGETLYNELSKLETVTYINNDKSPVFFDIYAFSNFSNEKNHRDMDYSDAGYRLLGLFRFWNAIEYYYPYTDILDNDWSSLLLPHISQMLNDIDRHSYEKTIASLMSELRDAHVSFGVYSDFYINEFGKYTLPVYLITAENKQVVLAVDEDYTGDCSLLAGDVLVAVDGVPIDVIIAHRKQYLSYPSDEKIVNTIAPFILCSHEKNISVTVLRDNEIITVESISPVSGNYFSTAVYFRDKGDSSHEILENNIAIINPGKIEGDDIDNIMTDLAGTEGLIVDLRQYPASSKTYRILADYIKDSRSRFAVMSFSSQAIPGVFVAVHSQDFYSGSTGKLKYTKPVVILIDETTQSHGEFSLMALRSGVNVTVMGRNTVGADGNVVSLPMPDGNKIVYTGHGVFTPDGGQTQRIGIPPDIYIEPTIEAIRQGRDEFIEQAILHILDENSK